MKKLLLILSMLALCLAPHGFAQEAEHERAMAAFKEGRLDDALAHVDEAIATHPDWWFPVVLKGTVHFRKGDYQEAIKALNDALTLEIPSNEIPKAKYYIAKSYLQLKEYPKAIHAFDEIIPQAPKSRLFDLYMNRGQSEMQIAKAADESNDKSKASSYYSKSIVSFSEALKNPAPKKNLEVEAAFQKAYAQYQIGNFQGSRQSLEKSIDAFKDVIERDPKEVRAHKFIINLSFRIAQDASDAQKPAKYDETVGYINRYLSVSPKDTDMIYKKGQALQGAKKYKEAIDIFKQVANARPKDGENWFSLGSCQMAAKRYEPAIGSFQKAMSNGQADNPSVYSFIAYCYQEQKNNCTAHDIPLYQNAVSILEKGTKAVSGAAKSALEQDLQRKRGNLSILRENEAADRANHKASIDNVNALVDVLAKNEQTLQRNQDMHIQQPTEDLAKAIEEGKNAIRSDRQRLEEELETIKKYITEARKCGAAKNFEYFNQMVSILKEHGKA